MVLCKTEQVFNPFGLFVVYLEYFLEGVPRVRSLSLPKETEANFNVNFSCVGNLLRAANTCLQNSPIFEKRCFSFIDLLS